MQYDAKTPDEYIAGLPEDRKVAISALRKVINDNLPKGFKETIGYGHIGWVVPQDMYPPGYHCDPAQPLPFPGHRVAEKSYRALFDVPLWGCRTARLVSLRVAKALKEKAQHGQIVHPLHQARRHPARPHRRTRFKSNAEQWIEIYEKSYKTIVRMPAGSYIYSTQSVLDLQRTPYD